MKFKENTGYLAGLTLLLSLGLLVIWEFWLESLILVDYLELKINKSTMDRWTFVVSCLSIVSISLILPFNSMKSTNSEMNTLNTALESERALSKIFFAVDNSVMLVIDNSNRIMQINQKTTHLLGYKEEELVGKNWISFLVVEQARDAVKSQYKQFIEDKNQDFIRFNAPVKSKNGPDKIIDWQCSPLKNESGKVYGTINSGYDISEQVRLRSELTQAKGKYETQIKQLTTDLDFNKQKYHSEAIKSANARARFRFWMDLDKHLIGLSAKDRNNESKVNAGIKKALHLFSDLSNVDQGYVFKFTQNGSHMINTHLWIAQEPLLEPDPSEEISLKSFPWFKSKMANKKLIHIPKVSEMKKEASAEKDIYLSQGIKSIVNMPLVSNGKAIGYVGFEANQKEKNWDTDEISVLKIIARLITETLSPSGPDRMAAADQPNSSSQSPKLSESPKLADIPEPPKGNEMSPESSSLKNELEKAKSQAQKELQGKLDKLQGEFENLQKELQERRQIETELRANRDELARQLNIPSSETEQPTFESESQEDENQLTELNLKRATMENKTLSSKPVTKNESSDKTEVSKQNEALRAELKKREAELNTLKTQLKSKAAGLTAKESETFKTKIAEKDKELTSLRKSFEEEKSSKANLMEKLKEAKDALKKHEDHLESLESAKQILEDELEELKKIQDEADNSSFQLEDTKQELENLEIANEQLMTDIEEKNFLIEEAKEKSTRYEQMDLPLFTLDQEGQIATWNKTAASLTGYIAELALEQKISTMFANSESIDFEKDILQPLRENSKLRIEVPIKKPTGAIFNALISLNAFTDRNGVLSTLGYMVNLSDASNEDEVKAIKHQFTALLGHSGLLLVNLTKDYQVVDINEKTEALFGWSLEDVKDKNFLQMVLPDDTWEDVSADIQNRMDSQSAVDLESTLNKENSELQFLWNLVAEVDPKDQSIQGILAIGQDVTDLRQSENKLGSLSEDLEKAKTDLKENEFLLNLLVDKAQEGLISIDEHGIIQSYNKGAESLFGYSSAEMIGQNVNRLMPEPYSKEHDNYIRKYLDSGESNFIGGPPREFIGKKKDGSTFPVEITLREIYKGYQKIFVGIAKDIRKRKDNEIELIKIREKYDRLFNAESNPVLIINGATQEIIEFNPAAPVFYGYDSAEFKEIAFSDLLDPEDPSNMENHSSGTPGLGSTQLIHQVSQVKKDGTRFPVNITTSNFRLNDTDYEMKIIHDQSQEVYLKEQLNEKQRETEERLREKSDQVEEVLSEVENQKITLRNEKMRAVEHITSSMVDLVNNPIQGIENILEQVKERAEMADIHKGLVTVAMNECRRVADLIGKLKHFQPPTPEDLEPLDVHQVIDEILQSNMDIINERTINLKKNYADDLPAIEAITQQIRQAIDNIIKNAEESFTDDNGTITIATEQDGPHIKIHIQDTGCGIPEKDMERIFDPFYTTKTALHRPGLGLLTSLGIVRNHKGEIEVHSQPGEGTRFTVTLPLKQPEEASNGSPAA